MQNTNGSQPTEPIDRVSFLLAQVLEMAVAAQPEALARLCALHPDCAPALRAAYASVERMDLLQVGQSGCADDASGLVSNGHTLPRTLGPFRLLELIGAGGMGTVYRAEDEELDRQVALKLVRIEMLASARTRTRFQREAAALARLDHPGLCTVYRSGSTDGQPWIAMRLVRGTTLAQAIEARRGAAIGANGRGNATRRDSSHARRELGHTVSLFEKIARALATAHAIGVVHRDLKPGNIVLTGDDEPVVIDFGLVFIEDSESHLTISGDQIGTPAYMAPEQVEPAGREPAPATDIYALGVTLFEALTLESPYVAHGREELFHCIVRGRRRRLRQVRRELPADLELVLEKTLELEPERRYASMGDLAEDLRRFLAHEPLAAGPPTSWYRLRKLARRYPGQIAAGSVVLLTAVVGALVTLQFALGERAKSREFDLLSAVPLYSRLVAAETALYPPWPDRVAAMELWQKDAARLLAMKPDIEQTVRDLRARALPWTDAEQAADRAAHPRLAEYASVTNRLASWRYAQAVREGRQSLAMPQLTVEQTALDEQAMSAQCMARVWPQVDEVVEGRSLIYGEEPLGLAFAQAAMAKVSGSEYDYQYRIWLARALIANGQDTEGLEQAAEAVRRTPDEHKDAYLVMQQEVEAAASGRNGLIVAAERRITELENELRQRRTFRFAVDSAQFLHDTLVDMLANLESLAGRVNEVDRRIGWSRQIGSLSVAHPGARTSLSEARAAIAAADDIVASKLYAGQALELRDRDVVGLVPIGMNPATKLWEFYDLRSAWDGASDPAALPIPVHGPDGRIDVTDATGIVFVLLPGGTFLMGSQPDDEQGPNHDPASNRDDETVHRVTLAPFFLSRYEMTQGQWLRSCDSPEARREPSQYKAGFLGSDRPVTLAHPVESVSWTECDRLLQQCGLVLPTEAQWEYGARAGTATPWSTGDEPNSLLGFANVLDRTGADSCPQWEHWGAAEGFEDHYTIHAPVGSFGANRFGLHDVHGNVWEWCRDAYGIYSGLVREGDGFRLHDYGSFTPCLRGGGFMFPARGARTAMRNRNAPGFSSQDVGLRPARMLRQPD